ncbi:MAG TPA: hypothetical protein VGX48_14475 [Pyrinomonadaceae bacterium]|nr:hypothetical protein [Pyrinomonadaceae bacterium]
MKRTSPTHARPTGALSLRRLTGFLIVPALAAALAYAPARSQQQVPPPNPGNTPTTPGRYFCEMDVNNTTQEAVVTFEFTRRTTPTDWLGVLRYQYRDGRVVEQRMQLFAPKEVETGTEWSFQTFDGKIQCKMVVFKGRKEVRFGNCNNKTEQYCLAETVVQVAAQNMPDCKAECAGLSGLELVGCMTNCAGRAAGAAMSEIDCSKHRVRCFMMRIMTWIARRGDPDLRTLLGLEEMYQNWVRFVNRSRGFGGSGSCIGYGYLCPGGTACLGDYCGVPAK